MSYGHIINGQIISYGSCPKKARRQDTGAWVSALPSAPLAIKIACGWYPVQKDVRPDDTATTTHDMVAVINADHIRITWVARAWTTAELEARADEAERRAARQQIIDNALGWMADAISHTANLPATTQANALQRIDLIIGGLNKIARVLRGVVRANRMDV